MTLKVANIGDSKCMLIRFSQNENSKILLKTEEQQHNFNAPYQLANLPANIENASKHKFWKDKVSDAVLYQCNVQEGDIVINATDGLFDNLYPKEIIKIVDVFMTECLATSSRDSILSMSAKSNLPDIDRRLLAMMTKKNAKRLAKELVKEAYRKSKSGTCLTPFGDRFDRSKMKKNNELLRWKGGKPDDICVIVGFVRLADVTSH